MELVGADVEGEAFGGGRPGLGDADHRGAVRRGVAVQQPAPGAVDVVHAVLVEERQDLGADQLGLPAVADVRQAGRLDHAVRDIDPEAVHPQVEPEAHDGLELGVHLRVVPVQIGLFGGEEMEVPVAALGAGPGWAAEDRLPVVGREFAAGAPARAEDVALPGEFGVQEPRVPVGGVVRHDVDDHPQAQLMGAAQQCGGVVEGAEERVDGAVVGDVVAAVGLR
ncbi:hypothetical protein Stsp01_04140 [Streptomyces sp. NBRC 13847]|nr:hypothetical protein Stsp01_04140 [Streptomyces sp. NBRC 13847]